MNINEFEVESLVENPDGSADLVIKCSSNFHKMLVQYGFIAILEKVIDQAKNEHR